MVESKDEKSGRKRRTQIWPRYHRLDVVRRLLADAGAHGAGGRYLIQHSAGSGKSNSIAVDMTLAGVMADEQIIADVVTGNLDVRAAAAELPEDDGPGDAEESADEYTIEQEVTV